MESAKFRLCEQLVGNDPEFDSLLKEQRQLEAASIAEAERVAAENRAKEEAERKRIDAEKRAREEAIIDGAIVTCNEMGLDEKPLAFGVFVGCTHEQKEENYHTFDIGSFSGTFDYSIHGKFVPALKLPVRIKSKMDNTSANDGYIEDSYGGVSITWRKSARHILGSTFEITMQINLEID